MLATTVLIPQALARQKCSAVGTALVVGATGFEPATSSV